MKWVGSNSSLTLAICASTFLAGCTSPLGRVRHQKPGDLTRRLDPNHKSLVMEENQTQRLYELKENIITGKPEIRTPPIEKVAGHVLKEYITRAYFEDEWPYRLWKFGDEVADWIDEQLQFDFYGLKGHITAKDDEIGITFSKEF